MRQIKFRGRKLNGTEWVFGYLVSACEIRVFITDEWEGQYEDFLVDPATVGEFTGLVDKNGIEIYEGDILKDGKGENGFVLYAAPQFVVQVGQNKDIYSLAEGKVNMEKLEYTEIIGNIHDNSELLK